MTDVALKITLLSCPGDTLQEHIDHIGMSQSELAERLGRPVTKVNELIKGKAPITKETATKLELVLGVPAQFWLNLERTYQDELMEIKQLQFLESCTDWLKDFPLKQLKDWGILSPNRNKALLAEELLKFFRIASPKEWHTIYQESSIAFKIELKHTTAPKAISVWLRLGELQAEGIALAPFDKKKIRASLTAFQDISYRHAPDWLEELQQLCATCGIALVFTPSLPKAPIYGASRWIKNHSIPLIQMTDRRKDYNAFWFTFYHELAHILKHGKKQIFLEGLDEITPDTQQEEEANAFAASLLLSDREQAQLIQYTHYDETLIKQLSHRWHKHPGIIIAQLQRLGRVSYQDTTLNALKAKVIFHPHGFQLGASLSPAI